MKHNTIQCKVRNTLYIHNIESSRLHVSGNSDLFIFGTHRQISGPCKNVGLYDITIQTQFDVLTLQLQSSCIVYITIVDVHLDLTNFFFVFWGGVRLKL